MVTPFYLVGLDMCLTWENLQLNFTCNRVVNSNPKVKHYGPEDVNSDGSIFKSFYNHPKCISQCVLDLIGMYSLPLYLRISSTGKSS